jgi:hypothetical protein
MQSPSREIADVGSPDQRAALAGESKAIFAQLAASEGDETPLRRIRLEGAYAASGPISYFPATRKKRRARLPLSSRTDEAAN